jgi:hypothetical protein
MAEYMCYLQEPYTLSVLATCPDIGLIFYTRTRVLRPYAFHGPIFILMFRTSKTVI